MARHQDIGAQMNRIIEKNPHYVIWGVVFLILVVDYFAVMQFQLSTLSTLHPKLSAVSEELSATKQNIERMPLYQDEFNALQEKNSRISQRIKTKEGIPVMMENIARVANEFNVRIVQIFPKTDAQELLMENAEARYYSVPVIVEAKADYHGFGKFLNRLEIDGAFNRIPYFSISANSHDPYRHDIMLTLDVIIAEKI